MWFDSWSDIARVLLVGTAAYAALVLILRLTGKRTLAKLNAFDLVVTVALGSVLATILLNASVSWSEGVTALLALSGLQFVVAATASKFPSARSLVTSRPSLLVRDGSLLPEALHRHRVAAAEVRQAVRTSGFGGLDQVAAVVLETDGSLSVIPRDGLGTGDALEDVH